MITSFKPTLIACAIVSWMMLLGFQNASAEPKQKQFDTPQQAADILVQVAANFDVVAAKEILGPDSTDIISSEDPVADKKEAHTFAAKAKEKLSIGVDATDPNRVIISVG